MMKYVVKELSLEDKQSVHRLFPLFSVLRPHLLKTDFVERVQMQAKQGYRIVYVEAGGNPVAASGFRVANFLAWGKVLYIDDLVTEPLQKRQGFAGALLDWLIAQAGALSCDAVHLDTGYARHDAHRLYLNKGFVMSSHHMQKKFG